MAQIIPILGGVRAISANLFLVFFYQVGIALLLFMRIPNIEYRTRNNECRRIIE